MKEGGGGGGARRSFSNGDIKDRAIPIGCPRNYESL